MIFNFKKDIQYYKFCLYGFLKNLRFFEAFMFLFFLEKGLNFFQIGTLYAIREITVNIFEIPTGIIADSLGRRRTLISAFILYIISFIVFYFSEEYKYFIIAILLFSLGDALRSGNHKAMIFEYLIIKGWKTQKIHYYGHTRSWSQIGSALSAIIGGFIVFYTGQFKYIFLFSIIPYIMDLILIMTYPKELDGEMQKFDRKKIWHNFRMVFRELIAALKNSFIQKAIANLSLYSGYYKAVKDYLQPVVKVFAISLPVLVYLEEKQRASIVVGLVYFILYLLTSFAARRSGRFAERFRNISIPLNISLLAGYLTGILSGLFFSINIYYISIIFFIMIYIIENLRKPIGIAYVSSAVDKKILASTLSTDSLVKSLTAAIIAPIIGFIADRYGVGNGMIVISVFMMLTIPLYLARMTKN